MHIVSGSTVLVVYSNPNGVLAVAPLAGFNAVESASVERMREISWMRFFTSLAEELWERSCESLARRDGCWETWTLEGRGAMMSV